MVNQSRHFILYDGELPEQGLPIRVADFVQRQGFASRPYDPRDDLDLQLDGVGAFLGVMQVDNRARLEALYDALPHLPRLIIAPAALETTVPVVPYDDVYAGYQALWEGIEQIAALPVLAPDDHALGVKFPSLDVPEAPARPTPYLTTATFPPLNFHGRQRELAVLNTWYDSGDPFLIIHGIGGIGKTALVEEWLNHYAAAEGVLWWDFHQSGANLSAFVLAGLVYLTGQPASAFDHIGYERRELLFLNALAQNPTILVLDGVERLMNAYLRHDEPLTSTSGTIKPPFGFYDARHGAFFRRLADISPSQTILMSRFFPDDLRARHTLRLHELALAGLETDDSLAILSQQGIVGDPFDLTDLATMLNHTPLLLHISSGHLRATRTENINAWRAALADEENIPRAVIFQCLQDLSPELYRVVLQVAVYQTTLDAKAIWAFNPYESRWRFHLTLLELERRGWLHWNRQTNRYHLHSVLRAYVMDWMSDRRRDHLFELHPDFLTDVQSTDDLQPYFAVYEALIGGGFLDHAAYFYNTYIGDVLRLRFGAYATIVNMLRPLFTHGLGELPAITNPTAQGYALHFLGDALYRTGHYEQALALRELSLRIEVNTKNFNNVGVDLIKYAELLDTLGEVGAAIRTILLALELGRAATERNVIAWANLLLLHLYGEVGNWRGVEAAYAEFTESPPTRDIQLYELRAELYYLRSQFYRKQNIRKQLNDLWEQAVLLGSTPEQILIQRYRGDTALQARNASAALSYFLEAVRLAQDIGSGSLAILQGGLARTYAQRNQLPLALKTIEAALAEPAAAHGHGDLYNSAAEVYLAHGDAEQAEHYAFRAYEAAWAEGFPYIYHWNVERAQRLLASMNQTEPTVPRYDPAHARPIPQEAMIRALIQSLSHPRDS